MIQHRFGLTAGIVCALGLAGCGSATTDPSGDNGNTDAAPGTGGGGGSGGSGGSGGGGGSGGSGGKPADAGVKLDAPPRTPDAATSGPCGATNQACCAVPVGGDPRTECKTAGTRCSVAKKCVTCGGPAQPCCRPIGKVASCRAGYECTGEDMATENPGMCEACGGSAQPCCTGANQDDCKVGLACNDPPGTTMQARCMNCGKLNAACCDGGNCQAGGRCMGDVGGKGGTCKVCGMLNGQCCKGGKCIDGGTACGFNAGGAVVCLTCGASGQICCSENTCSGGLTCKPAVVKDTSPTCG